MRIRTRRNRRARTSRNRTRLSFAALIIAFISFFPAFIAFGARENAQIPTSSETSEEKAVTEPVPTPSAVLEQRTPRVLGETTDTTDDASATTELTVLPATGAFPLLSFILGMGAVTAGSALGAAARRRMSHVRRSRAR